MTNSLLETPCNQHGKDLPAGAPPPERPCPDKDNWSPYNSRLEFEVAEFLFEKVQMLNGNVSELMNFWAVSLLAYGENPPFADHHNMLNVIDASATGDIPWQSFKVSYEGELPEKDVPSWMLQSYNVWFWDP